MRLLLTLFGVSVMMGSAGSAHGDPAGTDDGPFLASLGAAGITYTRPAQAIAAAKTVCTLIEGGQPAPEILTDLQNRNPALTTDHAEKFLAIAARSYCPEQLVPSNGSR